MVEGLNYTFDVSTSPHDMVKQGVLETRLSRVTVSSTEYPDWRDASQVAGCIALAVHGGMCTAIRPVI